jgi:hypothetical protein
MQTLIFLNKWHNHLYHVILAVTDEEGDYTLASRVSTNLADAHRLVEKWRREYAVAEDDVHDNSLIDLGKLLEGIEPTDFSPTNN